MKSLIDLVMAAVDLVDAEADSLKRKAARTGLAMSMGIVAALTATAGLGFILAGIFLLIARHLGYGVSAVLTGAAGLLLSLIFLAVWRGLR